LMASGQASASTQMCIGNDAANPRGACVAGIRSSGMINSYFVRKPP
jgi:hypothetical protein